MTLHKFCISFSLCFGVMPALYSNWQVEDFLTVYEKTFSVPADDILFTALKKRVKEQLKGSWCSEEKTDLLMDVVYVTRPEVCVEIGVFTGSSVLPVATVLQYNGYGCIYAIDAWTNEEAIRHLSIDDPNWNWWSTLDMKAVRNSFDLLVHNWKLKGVCHTLAMPSELALPQLPQIDFLHIDGNFSETGTLFDVREYLTKVKKGGYILLSNVYHTVKNKQPKLKALFYLFDTCEFVSEVDNGNAILFKKL